ncbi:DMT family transporter [Pseudooceanicola aestuarii]|uniref:DMT family transporter n=1 Tax=Pseudooceanicola aestuarii TaxID=2697319 RepID=UPI0013D4F639|nr:DMT family transporter [Pseudooceanicola aestuarii]
MTALAQPDPRRDTLRAAIWMMGAVVCFLGMAVAGRAVSGEYDTFEIMTYRSLVGLAVMIVLITGRGGWGQVTTARMGLHVLRNGAHFIGQNLWFFAITVIPLAQVFAIEFTGPIWVLVLSPLLLGEAMTRNRILATLAGFVGILIVTRPGIETVNIGVLAIALGAVCFALTGIMTKKLTRTLTTLNIVLWLTVLQTIFGLVCTLYDGSIALPTAAMAPWLVVIGCCGLAAHLCLTQALSLASAAVIMPLDFMRLPLAAIVGMSFYAEPLDIWVVLGASVIFAANYLNIRYETRPS